jgi:hypothetical protein
LKNNKQETYNADDKSELQIKKELEIKSPKKSVYVEEFDDHTAEDFVKKKKKVSPEQVN